MPLSVAEAVICSCLLTSTPVVDTVPTVVYEPYSAILAATRGQANAGYYDERTNTIHIRDDVDHVPGQPADYGDLVLIHEATHYVQDVTRQRMSEQQAWTVHRERDQCPDLLAGYDPSEPEPDQPPAARPGRNPGPLLRSPSRTFRGDRNR